MRATRRARARVQGPGHGPARLPELGSCCRPARSREATDLRPAAVLRARMHMPGVRSNNVVAGKCLLRDS